MITKLLKELWEWLMLVLLSLPAMLVGYLCGFVINGAVTGYLLHTKLHKPEDKQP